MSRRADARPRSCKQQTQWPSTGGTARFYDCQRAYTSGPTSRAGQMGTWTRFGIISPVSTTFRATLQRTHGVCDGEAIFTPSRARGGGVGSQHRCLPSHASPSCAALFARTRQRMTLSSKSVRSFAQKYQGRCSVFLMAPRPSPNAPTARQSSSTGRWRAQRCTSTASWGGHSPRPDALGRRTLRLVFAIYWYSSPHSSPPQIRPPTLTTPTSTGLTSSH